MGSKQANEINNNNKESKADSTRNGKRRTRSISLCEVEEEGYKEAKESTKREKMEREGNQHPLKQRKEEQATGTMRVNQKEIHHLSQEQIHFPKSHEE